MKTLLIILGLTVSVLTQGISVADLQAKMKAKKLKDVKIFYDKFKDRTSIQTDREDIVGQGEKIAIGLVDSVAATSGVRQTGLPLILYMSVGIGFKGEALLESPQTFRLVFHSLTDSWMLNLGDQKIYILFDGERLEISPSPLEVRGPIPYSTVLEYEIAKESLEKIIAAKSAELKLGDTAPRKWKTNISRRAKTLIDLTEIN